MASKKLTKSLPQAMIAFYIFLLAHPTGYSENYTFILWNVGQGQWSTLKTNKHCIHIDIGGEFIDWKKVLNHCGNKSNAVLLTHGDKDHINKIQRASRVLPSFCLVNYPLETLSSSKQRLLKRIKKCQLITYPEIEEIQFSKVNLDHSNELSRIFIVAKKILIPGDSTQAAEAIWSKNILRPKSIEVLILGHHGSKTSTSTLLLNKLSQLKLGYVSSRKKVYGHPHKIVTDRLKKKLIPTIKTESWGNIYIKL